MNKQLAFFFVLLVGCSPMPSTPFRTSVDGSGVQMKACNGQFKVNVYSNKNEQYLDYPSTIIDTSSPLAGAKIRFASEQVESDSNGQASFSYSHDVQEINFSVDKEHYISYSTTFNAKDNSPVPMPCVVQVSLSPLSKEEKGATPIPFETYLDEGSKTKTQLEINVRSVPKLPQVFKTDEKTQFSYLLINSKEELGVIENALEKEFKETNNGQIIPTLKKAIEQDNQIVAFSNNSHGLGDVFNPITHVFESEKKFVLATHLSGLKYLVPEWPTPFGDRFAIKVQFIVLPQKDKPIVFDVKKAGVDGEKVSLEIVS